MEGRSEVRSFGARTGMLAEKYIIIAVAGLAVVAGVVLHEQGVLHSPRETIGTNAAKFAGGYLSQGELPDSLAILPPPPQEGSAAMQRDEEARQAALALKGTPRYSVAIADAARGSVQTLRAFSCALGTDIDSKREPHLMRLLARMRIDARSATYRAKNLYRRPQPFVAHSTRTCLPSEEELVRAEGAYPSARSAVGEAYALVLAELYPARAAEIIRRGREFEKSRIICDVQWQSDVDAGRVIGEAIVARLKPNKEFQADFNAARAEVAAAMASGRKPTGDCEAESMALASARSSARPASR